MQDQTPGVGWWIQGQHLILSGRDDVFLSADSEVSAAWFPHSGLSQKNKFCGKHKFIKQDDLPHKHHSYDADAKCKKLTLGCQSFLRHYTTRAVL